MPDEIQDKLNSQHPNYKVMSADYWDLCEALYGGTKTMRAKGEKFLPKYDKEKDDRYKNRLSRTFLFPAYGDTIDRHSGQPFSRQVVVSEVDQRLTIDGDVNLEGESLTDFGKALYTDAENFGMSHVLVDMPQFTGDGSIAGDIAGNVRPKFIHIKAKNLYNWSDEFVDNKRQLTEIIYSDGENRRVRWTREVWEVYEKKNKDEMAVTSQKATWLKIDEGLNPMGKIPIVTVYTNRQGFMKAKPSLWNLAEQNLKHWQDRSDHDKQLMFARTGIYFASGIKKDEFDGFSIGPDRVLATQNDAGKFGVVEYKGDSIRMSKESLDDLKSEMERTGLQPEVSKNVDSTATGIVVNEKNTNTDVKVWAFVVEKGLEDSYALGAEWLGVELPEDFNVEVYKDFSTAGKIDDVPLLLNSYTSNALSLETYLNEIKLRGLISAKVDVEEEIEKIDNSEQSFNTFNG